MKLIEPEMSKPPFAIQMEVEEVRLLALDLEQMNENDVVTNTTYSFLILLRSYLKDA